MNPGAVISVAWLASWLLAGVFIVRFKGYDIWAGIALVSIGVWSLGVAYGLRWIHWG